MQRKLKETLNYTYILASRSFITLPWPTMLTLCVNHTKVTIL